MTDAVDYAQIEDAEAEWIARHFAGRVGRFLDIGAYDGFTKSKTRALALRGWSGDLYEPSRKAMRKLLELYENEPLVRLFHCAVTTDTRRDTVFWDDGGCETSTLDDRHRVAFEAGGTRFTPYSVQTVSLASILFRYDARFDFVNIDAEGISTQLLTAWPRLRDMPEVFCVEQDADRQASERAVSWFCDGFGYRVAVRAGVDWILVRR